MTNVEVQPFVYNGKVITCYDGDTCTVDLDLGFGIKYTDQILRLYGINAAEMKGGTAESKLAGLEARDYLRSLILNKSVLVQTFKDKKEKYGRYLAKIWIDQGGTQVCVNDLMVQNKHAVVALYE